MDISRQALFGRLNPTLFKAIESATAFCKLRGNPYVEVVHWLHQLLQAPDGDLQRVLTYAGVDRSVLDADLTRALAALPTGATSISDFAFQIETAIERAWVFATLGFADGRVRGAYLLTALLKTPELRRTMLAISNQFAKVRVDDLVETVPALVAQSPESGEAAYDGSGLESATPGEASGAMAASKSGKSALGQYCRDLTQAARAGELDPVIGREHEIRTMADILLRRRQNNPLITGEAGVGKTAVIEGLAQAIASDEVPPSLKGVRLLSLDVGALLAGASMRGEFEARLKGVLEEAANRYKESASDSLNANRKTFEGKDAYAEQRETGHGDAASEASMRYDQNAGIRQKARRAIYDGSGGKQWFGPDGALNFFGKRFNEDDISKMSAAKHVDINGTDFGAFEKTQRMGLLAKGADQQATNHSTILTNPEHSEHVLAYDVDVGLCQFSNAQMNQLRRMADWRWCEPKEEYGDYFPPGRDADKDIEFEYYGTAQLGGKKLMEVAKFDPEKGALSVLKIEAERNWAPVLQSQHKPKNSDSRYA